MFKEKTAIIFASIMLTSCGNPGDVSDEEYKKYKELGAPKILYSCTRTYNWLMVCTVEAKDRGSSRDCVDEAIKNNRLKEEVKRTEVGYSAGIGIGATYNKLLTDSKKECEGEFKVLESKE